ncbi:hypothetical protein NCH01_07230 [Neoasaia chiangmaiensis]|nr:hypothetical protein NCH01_07230 [Neoasaia chiangmaiensis]
MKLILIKKKLILLEIGYQMSGESFVSTTPSGAIYSFTYYPSGFLSSDYYDLNIKNTDGSNTSVNNIDTSSVISNGGSFSLGALNFETYIVPPGTTASISSAVGLLSAPTVYVGGTVSINSGLLSAATALTLNVAGGTANAAAGGSAINAASSLTVNLSDGGTFSASSGLIGLLDATTINFGVGGGTFVANAGGNLIDLSSLTINNYDPAKDEIEFQNTSSSIAHYNISSPGLFSSVQTITAYDANGNEVATVDVTPVAQLAAGDYTTGTGPLSFSNSNGNLYIGKCFLVGTLIETVKGQKAVEKIEAGDQVMAIGADGQKLPRAVIWVGQRHITVRPWLPVAEAGYPVCVLKNALGPNVPDRDLHITPEHCLYINGGFTPVRMFVNGSSIFYDTTVTQYTCHHVKTERHSIIVAQNTPTETYLDTGSDFDDAGGNVVRLFSRRQSWETDAAGPLVVDRETVEPLYRAFEDRARSAGLPSLPTAEVTNNAALHLVTPCGQVVLPQRFRDGVALFSLPSGIEHVQLVSRTAKPSDAVGPFVDDRRELGVLVGNVTLFDSGASYKIASHLRDPILSGWHGLESDRCRWTTGHARIQLPSRLSDDIGMLAIEVLAAGPYLIDSVATEFSIAV